ncbi:NADH-quinone oxidoreductase subunit C [Kribbella shirazensis]|uniref:Ni,Fe-hydrogenase III large subunit/Ni,Fe-hydrogenase III component G n=1 Tax=Kribbella shirazensis TaxID=1105143 RepID=A0A7X5VEW1_9ACTN|nr:NADH-quinone oxidoreductase subunit C [Kribbella shirazensis]NIK59048.1 Ni,Fe-hydrogenase III large subunit/Ni,Fe-hydrogenase III component G [Kribbella shirazensis]
MSPDVRTYPNRRQSTVTAASLAKRATELLNRGFRLALISGHDDPDGLRVVYLFVAGQPDRRVELVLTTSRSEPRIPSLAAVSFPAGRFERELHDLFGIEVTDHPSPRRLVLHQHWPEGWFPMRRDAGEPAEYGGFGDVDVPYPFLTVDGAGVYEIPVGPIHAGLIEPGHFRFSVVGETILKLKARLWFVHKGIEKLAEGKVIADVLPLAERVSGDSAVGHALAFCVAVEEARDWAVPPETQVVRAILLELERLYNHVTDIGALCNDVGYGIANAHAQRIREQLLRLNKDVSGHRLLRGAVAPGAVRVRSLPAAGLLTAIAADVQEIVDIALGNSVVRDRMTGTAVLPPAQAHDIGTLGYVARASGLDHDARRDHPFTPRTAGVVALAHTTGDVLSRLLTRVDEIHASVALIIELLATRPPWSAETAKPSWLAAGRSSGVGLVEGWRGTIAHRVEFAPDGTVSRLKIVDPSFFNWPALPVALADTIVPDFPLANKSFNLSYAGNDL